MWLGFLVMAFGALLILAPGRAQEAARSATWVRAAAPLGAAGVVAFVGKTFLHMPTSAQLVTLALCGLTVGLAGLASYGLLQSLLVPSEDLGTNTR
jgi:hypothetical protein